MPRTAIPLLLLSLTPLAPALAAGDAAAGQKDFASRCATCHAIEPGRNGIGPSLAGIVGRPGGKVPGYSYSAAMGRAHPTWDEETLSRFLANPQSVVHGTKMYVNVPDAQARQDIIAYLATLNH